MTALVLRGDARRLPLADQSVDAICTDPPYELGFMGRAWDSTGVAYDVTTWREALRVLKPGGHLLAFGGTRTWHRLTCAIEDAGFEIRDTIMWLYASGFPKSLNVNKDARFCRCDLRECSYGDGGLLGVRPLDRTPVDADGVREPHRSKPAQQRPAEPGVVPDERGPQAGRGWPLCARCGKPVIPAGLGTALKPGFEPIVVARRPLAGTVASNVLAYGTGALNIDGCRVGVGGQLKWAQPRDMGYHGGTDAGPVVATASDVGRWPTNVVLTHQPLLDDDGRVVGDACADGCVPGCPVADLDQQSGATRSQPNGRRQREMTSRGYKGGGLGQRKCADHEMVDGLESRGYGDTGGASRFFPTFRYQAKADDWERPVINGAAHPTVKPLDLIRWLCRLITPPGGIVLDQFAGSGTTLEAALMEGFHAIGGNDTGEYDEHIRYRADRARRRLQPGIARLGRAKPAAQTAGQGDLFDLTGGAL